jgi:hypothetical protein
VRDIQARLNKLLNPIPRLAVDGIFGAKTAAAVKQFQKTNPPLSVDGIVGPKTMAKLFPAGGPKDISYSIRLIPQPTSSQCWAASTAMMTKSTVAAVVKKTPSSMIGSGGGLLNYSSTHQGVIQGHKYGAIHGLACHPPMSWSPELLRDTLSRSPLMFDMLWRADQYVADKGSPGHMVVISGCSGEGANLTLSVLDPWPPNVGKSHKVNYSKWMQAVTTRTYRVFERRGY